MLLVVVAAMGIVACEDSSPTYTFITEDDVREIMDNVEAATKSKDIEGVIKYMAPSVEINMTMETPFGKQEKQLSREQHKTETEKGWSMMSDYKYKRENEKISISDDSQSATVETDIIEEMELQWRRTRSVTHEKVIMEIVDGELLVTRMDGDVRMLPR